MICLGEGSREAPLGSFAPSAGSITEELYRPDVSEGSKLHMQGYKITPERQAQESILCWERHVELLPYGPRSNRLNLSG